MYREKVANSFVSILFAAVSAMSFTEYKNEVQNKPSVTVRNPHVFMPE